jgi:hypothetical protein
LGEATGERKGQGQEWDSNLCKFRCTECLLGARSVARKHRAGTCRPLTGEQRGHLMGFVSNGHTLKAIRSPVGVQLYVFCTRCGRYASGKGAMLNQLCVPEKSGQLGRLRKLLEGKHLEKGHWLGEVVSISLAGLRGLMWHEGNEGGHEEPGQDEEQEEPPWEVNNQYNELQRLEEQWELLRQQMVSSPLWQAGRGLEQVSEGWGFDEPDWQMAEEGEAVDEEQAHH